MTEAEWLACEEPEAMLDFVRRAGSERKWRLLMCAACRQHWHVITKAVFQDAVELAERFADGLATEEERDRAYRATGVHVQQRSHMSLRPFLRAFHDAVCPDYTFADPDDRGRFVHTLGREPIAVDPHRIRDIFGNPFRSVAFSPAWRTDTAVSLARAMYDSRDFGAMPILADALQDAGCDDEQVLAHCRDANQPHVRGCWVVDGVLGKE